MRVLALIGVALMIFAIPRLARLAGVEERFAIWLGVLNPLVLVHLIGDAHNDALMIGLMMAGLTLAIERRPAAGAVMVTLAALVKAPAGLALIFIVPLWAAQLTGRARLVRAALAAGGIGIATVVGDDRAGRHRVRLDRRTGYTDAGPHLDLDHHRPGLLGVACWPRITGSPRPTRCSPGCGWPALPAPARSACSCCASTGPTPPWASASGSPRCSPSVRWCIPGTCCGPSSRWRPRRPRRSSSAW